MQQTVPSPTVDKLKEIYNSTKCSTQLLAGLLLNTIVNKGGYYTT